MKITLIKGIAIVQMFVALLGFFVAGESWPFASMTIAVSLALILMSNEALNDERVEHLKLKATKLGLGVGIVVIMWLNLFAKLVKGLVSLPPLSAFDSLIVILAIAVVAFHYWRWQDGRGSVAVTTADGTGRAN
jgi:hypothetical protein